MKRLLIYPLALAMGLAACQSTNETSSQKDLVSIYPDQVISDEFIGNGVEWSAYPHADADDAEWGLLMTDAKWQKVFDRLDFMQPRIARVMDQANWRYLEGFDDKGEPILNFESQEMKSLYKLLDYCQEHNVTVILGEWGQPYKVHDPQLHMEDKFTGANDPNWIKIITANLKNLIQNKQYTCIKYYNLVNEPNGYWASTDGDWEQWKEGITMLNTSIKEAGLSDHIAVIGPDATPYNNDKSKYTGYNWAIEAVRQLGNVLGAYDVHDYPQKDFVRSGEFGQHYKEMVSFADSVNEKPFIFGEIGFEKYVEGNIKRYEADSFASPDSQLGIYDYDYGVDMADAVIQAMNAGFDATLAWGLDDAMHTNGDSGDKHQLKKWGMWNILGTELTGDSTEENIRPWFYTWSLMCRYFPGEMNIVKSDSVPAKNVRMTAGVFGKYMSMAIVNNSDSTANFTVHPGNLGEGATFKKFLYTEKQRHKDENGFPKPVETDLKGSTALEVEVPARSFVLYTSYNY
ncbi:hypothetical protein [Fulvivirga ligni]|uniref:hypothetical protein n=1 Tax=Fulvivirga ligni TaxID=2904246 RepID=UPI001F1E5028|nr:hypothetical protein [Fulvivirga ligni]UII20690.1 hypothetical protein LVD16_22885 [Fulvivirga ligni]